jgi:PAS domain S-box-containing protein
MQIYYFLNLFFVISLCVTLLILLGRYESSDPKIGAFRRMLLGVMAWAFFDHAVAFLSQTISDETLHVLFRYLSFLFLFFQPAAMELILTFTRQVSTRDRLFIYVPFVGIYLAAILFPQWVNTPIVRLVDSNVAAPALWNLSFRIYSLLVCGILLAGLWRKARNNKDVMGAKEQLTVFYGGTATLAAVIFSQLSFEPFKLSLPLTANLSASLVCLATFWALKRYSRAFEPAALHRSTVTLTPSGMIHLCGQAIRWANPSMGKLLGIDTPDALNGQPIDAFIDRKSLKNENATEFVQRLNNGEVQDQEITLTGPNSNQVVCLATSRSFVPNNPDQGGLVVFTDITERKQTEEALKESEEKYRKLVERADDGIVIVQDDYYVFANQRMAEMLDYSVEELVGQHHLRFFPPDKAPAIEKRHKERMAGIQRETSIETIMIQRKGTEIEVEALGSYITYRGHPANIVFNRDISARKKAAREKQKMEALLLRAQKMEAIGALAGGVAHDLNNILSGIVSYPELLLLRLPEDSPFRKHILAIQKSGQKAASIVQDLLTLARRGVAINEVVNLNNTILDYLNSPEHKKLMSFHPDAILEHNLDEDLFNIIGSPVHLSKTIMNLVSNAAEAMPSGGKITISTETRYLDRPIGTYNEVLAGEYATFTVSDQGIGMSPEERERIFEPFYTKKKMGRSGTGLGMAVVWGTVNDHNGYIVIDQNVDKGTSITLYFPVTRTGLKQSHGEFSIEVFMGHGEKIVVVDDVAEQLEIAEDILTQLGYTVITHQSGEDAVAYLKHNTADLLILDMIMDPGMDGLETYREVRKLHPHQKAIIASGYAETKRVHAAQEAGAGAYVKKPYTIEAIAAAVKNALNTA